jgi:inner membrane protein
MASAYTHLFVAACTGVAITPGKIHPRLLAVGVVGSLIPDADVFGFELGVPYEHLFGHRGISHSLLFAVLFSLSMTLVLFPNAQWAMIRGRIAVYLFLVTASHGLFDAMTNGGLGVAFFTPIDDTRYFLPFRPIQVSPIGPSALISPRLVSILLSEIIWIWIPCIVIAATTYFGLSWVEWRRSVPSAA